MRQSGTTKCTCETGLRLRRSSYPTREFRNSSSLSLSPELWNGAHYQRLPAIPRLNLIRRSDHWVKKCLLSEEGPGQVLRSALWLAAVKAPASERCQAERRDSFTTS